MRGDLEMCDHSLENGADRVNSALRKGQQGFSLLELIIVMFVFLIVIGITMNSFDLIVKQFSLQSRNVESNIAGVLGLEMLRVNLDSAGYGVPLTLVPYNNEAVNAPYSAYNEAAPTTSIPRSLISGNNVVSADNTVQLTGTDFLVVKSTAVGTTTAAQRWTYMSYLTAPKVWSSANLAPGDFVVGNKYSVDVDRSSKFKGADFGATKLIASQGEKTTKTSGVEAGGSGIARFDAQMSDPSVFAPIDEGETSVLYGVTTNSGLASLRMPFNRADFYVRRPAVAEWGARLPDRCAPNTGILYKAIISQNDGTEQPEMPLLDCVADLQVVYTLAGGETDTLGALDATQIRTQLKAVSVYVLTHEGRRDPNFWYPNGTIGVGPGNGIVSGTGSTFDLAARIGAGWQNYRWKVYHMTIRPQNLITDSQI